MKKMIFLWMAWTSLSLAAQNSIDRVLQSVEANNTTLKALREGTEAQKLENRTGIFLENPELGFNYLWGIPGAVGNRTDISVTQKFDIPTLSGLKSRIADGQNSLAELQYLSGRKDILLEARLCGIELIYFNALEKEMEVRLGHAKTIAGAYDRMLEQGDINRLEYNKAQLNLSAAEGEMERIGMERSTRLSELKRLNGGQDLSLDDSRFEDIPFLSGFEDWYAQAEQHSPVLAYVRQEVEVGRKRVSLSRAMGLPVFSGGYMSEKVAGEHFQGLTLGITIPLWENRNRVRQARAAVRAAEKRSEDAEQQLYGRLQILYSRAAGLKRSAEKYRRSLTTLNNADLLKKALDAGEISLLEYIVETGLLYETVNRALEAERDFNRTYAELSAVMP
ncbi:MAG: TolC family protein [Tannerella sp.]|jgi:outer membrane protein TolC|nr:TolC family protein [Tannerella sp.]